jgi:hypothetical protein
LKVLFNWSTPTGSGLSAHIETGRQAFALCYFVTGWDAAVRRCMHSLAVEALHASEELSNIPEQLYTRIDFDVTLDNADSVAVVNTARGLDFLLSVAMETERVHRVFVGGSSADEYQCLECRSFSCQHCIFVSSWVERMEAEEFELGDIFCGFGLRGTSSQTQQPTTTPNLPISQRRLLPTFSSAVLAARAVYAGQSMPSL